MSGDIQPRKKKKTARRKQPVVSQSQVEAVEEPLEVEPAKVVIQEAEAGSEKEGGGILSKVIFFILLSSFVGTGTLVACDYRSGQVSSLLGKEAFWPNFQGIYLPQGFKMPSMEGLRGLVPSWEDVEGLGGMVTQHFKDPVGGFRNVVEGVGQVLSDFYQSMLGFGGKGAISIVDVVVDFVTTLASVGSSFVAKFPSYVDLLVDEAGEVYSKTKAAVGDGLELAKENFPFLHPAKDSFPSQDDDEPVENVEISQPTEKVELFEHIQNIEIIEKVEVAKPEKEIKVSSEQVENTPNLPVETNLNEKNEVENTESEDMQTQTKKHLVEDIKKIKQKSEGDNDNFGAFIPEPEFLEDELNPDPLKEPIFVEEFAFKIEDDHGRE